MAGTNGRAVLDPTGNPARLRFRNSLNGWGGWGGGAYDAALPNLTRQAISAAITDARRDLHEYTRRELLRRARYLYRNSPITHALIERLITLTIGPGLIPIPASSDREWNKRALQSFLSWTRLPDLQSRMSWWQMQRVVARGVFVDGDIFTYLTVWPENNRPRIQFIESHLVRSKESGFKAEPDGVNLDRIGRPLSFTVWESSDENSPSRTVPAAELIQHLNYERARQYRGVSMLSAAINTAQDVQEILALEKSAVKSLSARKDIIKNSTGEIDPAELLRAGGVPPATPSPEERSEYYRRVLGPETLVLAHGDDAMAWDPKRPSPTWEGFMDFLANTICLSTNLPPSVVLQMKVGGADTRRDLAMAQRVISVWQQDFAAQFERHYLYVINADIEAGFIPDPPNDWRNVSWQYPKDLTVDAGRQAQQDREDVRTGLLSLREYFGRFQLWWEDEITQVGRERVFVKDLESSLGLNPGEIMDLEQSTLPPEGMIVQAGREDES